jgi:intracellular sulfur oxidation DsrE/DsrF family protein
LSTPVHQVEVEVVRQGRGVKHLPHTTQPAATAGPSLADTG